MKGFQSSDGTEWEVTVGRESWGTVVAIFFRREGAEPPRQALLDVSSADEGSRVLLGMSQEGLEALLRESVPKPVQ